MSMLRGTKNTKATLWQVTGHDKNGSKTFSSPQVFDARFIESSEIFYDETGSPRRSEAVLYFDKTDISGQADVGDVIINEDKGGVTDPTTLESALNVRFVKLSEDFNQIEQIYRVLLA